MITSVTNNMHLCRVHITCPAHRHWYHVEMVQVWHVAEHRHSVGLVSSREGSAVEGELGEGPAVRQTQDVLPSEQTRGKVKEKGRGGGKMGRG